MQEPHRQGLPPRRRRAHSRALRPNAKRRVCGTPPHSPTHLSNQNQGQVQSTVHTQRPRFPCALPAWSAGAAPSPPPLALLPSSAPLAPSSPAATQYGFFHCLVLRLLRGGVVITVPLCDIIIGCCPRKQRLSEMARRHVLFTSSLPRQKWKRGSRINICIRRTTITLAPPLFLNHA